MKKEKRLDFELLRLIAIFFVVFNHTDSRGFTLYKVPGGSTINNVFSLLLAIVCKIAVPLFLLISGGLLLPKEEPIKDLMKKRVLRIALVLVLFSALSYGVQIHWGSVTEPGIWDFFRRLWSEGVTIPYWYLYTYLALMLMLPLLRPMVKAMPDRAFHYLFLLHAFCYGVLTPLGYFLGFGEVDSWFFLPVTEWSLFYFLMGYYLAERFPWEKMGRKQLFLAGLAAAAGVGLMFALTWYDFSRNGESTQYFMWSYLYFLVFFLYALVHQLTAWHPIRGRWAKWIQTLGGCTFGTYLLEGILRGELDGIYRFLEPRIHVLPACLVWVTAVVVCGLAVTWFLKKIPGLKKLL